jgi:hypothetical protein
VGTSTIDHAATIGGMKHSATSGDVGTLHLPTINTYGRVGSAGATAASSGSGNISVVARLRARYSPKRSVDVLAYILITDEVTKARWRIPVRIKTA